MTKFTYVQKTAAVKLYLESQSSRERIKKYMKYYNFDRIQHTLKGKTPMEYWNLALEKYSYNVQF